MKWINDMSNCSRSGAKDTDCSLDGKSQKIFGIRNTHHLSIRGEWGKS